MTNNVADQSQTFEWSCLVTCRNEHGTIGRCLQAISTASGSRKIHVTVIVNGSTDGSVGESLDFARGSAIPISIYDIVSASKSNAIDQFFYHLRPSAETYFFIDGYARVNPDSLAILADALHGNLTANAAAAVPSSGRSAAALRDSMVKQGGLHGSFFALSGTFVDRLVTREIHLPNNLYRGDGLIGSLVAHDIDPKTDWQPERVYVATQASWKHDVLSPWRLRDLTRYGMRQINQARGRMESAAIKNVIYTRGYEALPRDANDMILSWLRENPDQKPSFTNNIFGAFALRMMSGASRPTPEQLQPSLIFERP